MESGSIAIAKSKGESGHPWLVPLVKEKYGERIAFVLTHACGDEYKSLIQEAKVPPTPNFCRTVNKYSHSIRSKAFSASNEITASGTSVEWEV